MRTRNLIAASAVALSGVAAVAACGSSNPSPTNIQVDANTLRALDQEQGFKFLPGLYVENLTVLAQRCTDYGSVAQAVDTFAHAGGVSDLSVLQDLVDMTAHPGKSGCVAILEGK